jgi:hypothetical protein
LWNSFKEVHYFAKIDNITNRFISRSNVPANPFSSTAAIEGSASNIGNPGWL